ncbi:MAG: diguanylate cyclase [Pseudomonadota bacterium]
MMVRSAIQSTWLIKIIVAMVAIYVGSQLHAFADNSPVELDNVATEWKISTDQLDLAIDIPADVKIEDVAGGKFEQAFSAADQSVPKVDGYGKTIWGRVTLNNSSGRTSAFSLVAKYPQLDHIDWFVVSSNGHIEHSSSGQFEARGRNQMASRFPTVSTRLADGESKRIYFRIQSETVVILPLRVYPMATWLSHSINAVLFYGLLIGCLMTMAALGLISFFGSKHWSSLWFSVFCVASAGYILTASGMDKAYFWPGRTGDYLFLLFVFQGVGMAATALFVDRFLKTKSTAPWLYRLLRVQAGVALLTCFTTPLPMAIAALGFTVTMAIGPVVILIGVVSLWRKGVPGAGLVVLSWIPNQLGAFWVFLRAIDVAPYTDINHYALPVFCTLTAVTFVWALHRQNAESAHRATHDLLTGLPNRFGFEQTIARASGGRPRPLAVMQIDLDGFKAINDTHGHTAGDFVLQEVSARLRAVCEPEATPFRNGGDEFIVFCSKRTRQSDVEALANAIIRRVAEPIVWRDRDLTIGASVGIAFPMGGGANVLSALEDADAALYTAKQNGKGCLVTASFPTHSEHVAPPRAA